MTELVPPALPDAGTAAASLPPLSSARIPRATYRLQFNTGFRFNDATAIVPYLAALGIDHLYASPILKARPGSTHGYDVVDAGTLNPEIGSDDDFAALGDALRAHGMRLLLDIVPNHMGVIEADNGWWLDVLENGPAAERAKFFDIEWQPPQREHRGKIVLPVLGGAYGEALEACQFTLAFDAARGQFVLSYFTHRFPIDASDHGELLGIEALPAEATSQERLRIEELRTSLQRLPSRDAPSSAARALRQRDSAALKQALAGFHDTVAWAPAWLAACAERLHGQPGEPRSFDALDSLLQRQAFRLAHWRAASDQINYRRFFDVNALASLRMEDEAVFDAAHRRVLGLVAAGQVHGLRVDHPDGMTDPAAYFQRLQRRCVEALAQVQPVNEAPIAPAASEPRALHETPDRPKFSDPPRRADDVPRRPGGLIYLVLEKILAEDEPWPRDWPSHGDTGYRFSNQVNGVFVDTGAAAAFDALYADFVGAPVDYEAELDAAKRQIMSQSLAADLRLLTEMAREIALENRHTRDLTRNGLSAAIVEITAAFDVYRSYVDERGTGPVDRARIERYAAVARARIRPSQLPYVEFLRQLLLRAGDEAGRDDAREADASLREQKLRFVRRLQQFTAPVMAKAMEDTAFYRYHRLVSLNDVGGDPRRFGFDAASFHAANAARLRDTPHTLLGTSTHDSKRSEDLRCRLDVLSEMPERWAGTLVRWRELAQAQWRIASADEQPSPNDQLLLFQTLFGLWPADAADLPDDAALAALRERVCAYMLKAVREAKQHSSWLDGDDGYEAALQRCIEVLIARLEPNPFITDLRRVVAELAPFGCSNSLGTVVLKLTSPGVPDIYQGCEDWAFSLVDPDNRRPVDFAAAERRLRACAELAESANDVAETLRGQAMPGGLHKVFVTSRLLQWRRDAEVWLRDAGYQPLDVVGEQASNVIAFARCAAAVLGAVGTGREDGDVDDTGTACAITVVTRQPWKAAGGDIAGLLAGSIWGDTRVLLPADIAACAAAGAWRDVIAGRQVQAGVEVDAASPLHLADLLRGLPHAVLVPAPAMASPSA